MWGYGASSYRHGCRGQKTIIFSSVIQDSLYARCMQPVQVQMKTYWHRCSSPEPRNLYLHFQKIRKSHREIPTRTGKKMVKNICHGKFWEEKIPVLALSWIKAFLNMVSMGLWAIKPCKIEKQWPKKIIYISKAKTFFITQNVWLKNIVCTFIPLPPNEKTVAASKSRSLWLWVGTEGRSE